MKRLLILFAALSAPLWGAETSTGAASVSSPWLRLSQDARASAMGEAQVAVAEGASAMSYNPAALSKAGGQVAGFTHLSWIQGSSIEHLAYSMPLLPGSGLGASLDFLSLGAVKKYSVDSTGTPVEDGTVTPGAMNLSAGYGQALPWTGLSAGIVLKAVSQTLDGSSSAWSVATDLGAGWSTPLKGLSAGLTMQNVGTSMQGSSLPLNMKVGVGYENRLSETGRLGLAMDSNLNFAASDGSANTFNIGGEFWYQNLVAGRLGYQGANREGLSGLSGLTVGLGLLYKGFELDYALHTVGEIGNGNQLSLQYHFGGASPAPEAAKAAEVYGPQKP